LPPTGFETTVCPTGTATAGCFPGFCRVFQNYEKAPPSACRSLFPGKTMVAGPNEFPKFYACPPSIVSAPLTASEFLPLHFKNHPAPCPCPRVGRTLPLTGGKLGNCGQLAVRFARFGALPQKSPEPKSNSRSKKTGRFLLWPGPPPIPGRNQSPGEGRQRSPWADPLPPLTLTCQRVFPPRGVQAFVLQGLMGP